MLHDKHKDWIAARGIDPALAETFGLSTINDGSRNWLRLPYVEAGTVLNHKYRLTSEKRHRMDVGAPLSWWNMDCLMDGKVRDPAFPVIVTEGELDALATLQSGWQFVLSVPNGAPQQALPDAPIDAGNDAERFRFLHRAKQVTDTVARFVIATDNDAPGLILAFELVRRLGPERCWFVTYPSGCKDLNDVLMQCGEAGVLQVLNDAKPYPMRGLYRVADFPEPAPVRPIRIRIPGLYDNLPIAPGTFTVATGYAGQGKTSVIMAIVADLLLQGVNVALASFETAVRPILENKLRAHILGCSDTEAADTPSDLRDDTDRIIAERLSIIAQQPSSDDADMSLDDVLELARTAVIRDGVKALFLDPWNEVEHKRLPGETETEYIGRAIRMIKRFARDYQVAVWLVAHPSKPKVDRDGKALTPTLYDISGSANFANKADYGVIIHRLKRDSNEVDIHVSKVRMGLPGKMGSVRLAWNWRTSSYSAPSG